MKRVIIESPYAAFGNRSVEQNIAYAVACLQNSLLRGEAPFISHLLYPRVLNNNIPAARKQGKEAGLTWGSCADLTAVYVDYGITPGMQEGIDRAVEEGRPVEERKLYE